MTLYHSFIGYHISPEIENNLNMNSEKKKPPKEDKSLTKLNEIGEKGGHKKLVRQDVCDKLLSKHP